jgi:hypothetical protein
MLYRHFVKIKLQSACYNVWKQKFLLADSVVQAKMLKHDQLCEQTNYGITELGRVETT